MEFQEDMLERQTRVRREWGKVVKGGLTCIQFLPIFEAAVSELVLAELGKPDRELFLAYLEKVGGPASQVVLADRRAYPTPGGGPDEFRKAKTWREAHKVLQEHERALAGGRSLLNQPAVAGVDGGGLSRRAQRRAQKAAAAGDSVGVAPVSTDSYSDLKSKPCYEARDQGTCTRVS